MEYPIKIKGKTVKQVKKLNLSHKNLKTIPDNVYQYANLEKLDLSYNRIEVIPQEILKLKKLRTLDLAFNNLKVLQGALFKLPKLKILNLHGNQIKHLPKQILDSKITTLILSKNKIEHLDESLISGITKLDIVDNPVSYVDELVIEDDKKVVIPSMQLLKNETENKKIIMHKDKKKIFISYSHADEIFHNRLMTHLSVLKKYIGGFEEWSDKKIHAGQHWKEEIKKALDDANIAILLVSTDFLASDFIENNELPPILRKAEAENTNVLCLLVEPSFFLKSELSEFQAVNKPEETLAEMEKPAQERVFLKLMDEIQRIIEVE